MAMMAITTRSSINVKATFCRRLGRVFMILRYYLAKLTISLGYVNRAFSRERLSGFRHAPKIWVAGLVLGPARQPATNRGGQTAEPSTCTRTCTRSGVI